MLVWLDGTSNVKGKPNENYARELLELFSLGVGNYTEQDVREAAHAFTGWHTTAAAQAGGRGSPRQSSSSAIASTREATHAIALMPPYRLA